MDEQKIHDVFPGWKTVRTIGSGSYGTVYEIARDDGIVRERAALKAVTVPQNPSEIEALYDEGYDDRSVTATFKTYLNSIVKEYTMMRELSGSANVVKCDDIRYIQHDDGIGWDIYIRMELLTPLTKALGKQIAEAEVVRIGRDLSRALTECAKRDIVHRDIKPENIFVSETGDYKLGDFGIARTMDKTTSATVAGTYDYMAPEVYYGKKYGASVDVYSLGMVLYWLLNERRTAFLKLSDTPPSAAEKEEARTRRLRGDPLPPPAHGSLELKRIVRRACAFDPKDRYRSAEELLEALEDLEENRQDKTLGLFSQTNPTGEPEREEEPPETQPTVQEKTPPKETPEPTSKPTPKQTAQRSRLPAIAAIALGAALIILAAVLLVPRLRSGSRNQQPAAATATETPAAATATPTPEPEYIGLSVRCVLDGESASAAGDGCLFDVYINGERNVSDAAAYNSSWPAGTRYEIRNVRAGDGREYIGTENNAGLSGTLNAGTSIVLTFASTASPADTAAAAIPNPMLGSWPYAATVKDKVDQISTWYNKIENNSKEGKRVKYDGTLRAYWIGNSLQSAVVSGTGDEAYYYYFHDGAPFFAILDPYGQQSRQIRLYFWSEGLFRWIDEDKSIHLDDLSPYSDWLQTARDVYDRCMSYGAP